MTKNKAKAVTSEGVALVRSLLEKEGSKRLLALFELIISTGIRKLEAFDIKRSDVKFGDASAAIFIESDKTGEPLTLILRDQDAQNFKNYCETTAGEYVFRDGEDPSELASRTVYREFALITKKAGLDDLTLSAFRAHYFRNESRENWPSGYLEKSHLLSNYKVLNK